MGTPNCPYSNPPAVNKSMKVSSTRMWKETQTAGTTSDQMAKSEPLNLEITILYKSGKKPVETLVSLNKPGKGDTYAKEDQGQAIPVETPVTSYKPGNALTYAKVDQGQAISKDPNLRIPSTQDSWVLASKDSVNDPAQISCLRRAWGGHVTLDGGLWLPLPPKKTDEGTGQSPAYTLTDYILFEWDGCKKGSVVLAPPTPYNNGNSGFTKVEVPLFVSTSIDISPQNVADPKALSLSIDYEYKEDLTDMSFSFKDAEGQVVKYGDLLLDKETKLNEGFPIDPQSNAYGLLDDASITFHTKEEYAGFITFTGTILVTNGPAYELTDVIIHQWDLRELI